MSSKRELSPLEKQAVDALRRARRLPWASPKRFPATRQGAPNVAPSRHGCRSETKCLVCREARPCGTAWQVIVSSRNAGNGCQIVIAGCTLRHHGPRLSCRGFRLGSTAGPPSPTGNRLAGIGLSLENATIHGEDHASRHLGGVSAIRRDRVPRQVGRSQSAASVLQRRAGGSVNFE